MFLALEYGDKNEETRLSERENSAAANDICRKIADAPASHRPMIEKVVVDLLDNMRQSVSR